MWTPEASPSRARLRATFAVHLFVVGLVAASCAWILTDELKRIVVRTASPLLDWASIFHHPADAALFPYVASALAAFGWGLSLYVRLRRPAYRAIRRLQRRACARHVPLLAAIAGAQALLVIPSLPRALRAALGVLSVVACVVRRPAPAGGGRPLLRAARAVGAALLRPGTAGVTAACVAVSAALLIAIAVEPVRLATGPVRLLNEYRFLPQRMLADPGSARGDLGEGADAAAARLCRLAFANPTEFGLQTMSQGQINHVGHVLNPINEVETGKPLERTYFQYGVGATFVFKWVMDLSGGPALQTYYRSLLFFVAYWLVFVAAAAVLLRDARYVLAAVGLLAATHYLLGYEALLLAPGINPILHFLDLPVLLACVRFFRTGRLAPLALGALGVAAGLATNRLFGTMVAAAFAVSAGMYVLENVSRGRRAPRLAALLLVVPLAAVAWLLPRTGGGDVTAKFVAGLFSWGPSPWLTLLALAYLSGSYLFLLWARERRDAPKYAVVYLFVYAQGFLLYFFWSGLNNHFWPALPYVGLHLLLVLRLLAASSTRAGRWEGKALAAAILGIAFLVNAGIGGFVSERNGVHRIFSRWETHRWPFARARVIATADPAPIAASLAQIERYSAPGERGICVLSVFDNLLPFLAARHSIFPHFDLQWALLTDEDRRRAVDVVASARQRYLFVGREVEAEGADPLDRSPCGLGSSREQESARGRLRELRRVFDALSAGYERIETGPLLSVYRRRDTSS